MIYHLGENSPSGLLRGQACYVRARDAYAHGRKRKMNEELTLPIVPLRNDV